MNSSHVRLLKKCSNYSQSSFDMAALITDGNKFVLGWPKIKSHPRFGSGRYKNIHAEGMAISNAFRHGLNLEKSEIFIFRKNYNLAKPCTDCMDKIIAVGIQKVHYTNNGCFETLVIPLEG